MLWGHFLAHGYFILCTSKSNINPHLHESLSLIKEAPFGEMAWRFWLVILLAFVNWGIEARKWQVLIKTFAKNSFSESIRSVLSGLALSLNTPNRMGEYGGRILYVKDGSRLKAISLSIAGSISQLIITLIIGMRWINLSFIFSKITCRFCDGTCQSTG